jgi:IS5 family transposase
VIGRPFAFMLTGGNAADSPVAPHLLAGLKGARYLLADKGYDANSLRKHLRQSHIVPVIPAGQTASAPSGMTPDATRAAISSKTPSAA